MMMSSVSATPPVTFSRCVSRRKLMRLSLIRASNRLASVSTSGMALSMIIACNPFLPNASRSWV
jgi:hypothetical protein